MDVCPLLNQSKPIIAGTSVPSQPINSLLFFFKRWGMRMLINIKSELSMFVNRLRHYRLFTIPSSYLNRFSFEVPTLIGPWSLIRAYFLHDAIALTKTVGTDSFIHGKSDNGACCYDH